ncbi:MAG: beta strand repeat-containing protein [Chitinophagales bacterium]
MGSASKIAVAVLILFYSQPAFSQQLRLGKNPYAVEKSAVLELYADNQGLLLPRIADTSLINILNPPDGMIIYFSPGKLFLVRSNGYWQGFASAGSGVTSLNGNTGALTMDTSYISSFSQKIRSLFSGTAPIIYSNGLIGITQATTSTNGYLSSVDWNTFNSKLSSIDTTNISNFSIKVRSLFSGTAPITYSNGLIGITQATTSTNGYLSSADWNTFNNKLSSIDTTNISTFSVKVRSLFSGTAPITYSNGLIGITQATTSTNGYLSSVDWNTFNNKLSSIDSTNISNFSVKVRSLFSGTAPITYSNGLIGITQATTSTNGYLSSADWNTFNSKANSFTNGNLSETGSGILTITGGTGSVIGTGTSIQVKQATTAQSGYLSSADWNTFNNKLSSIDTTNISNFSVKVRSLFSGTAPITYSNGLIGITQATTSTNGYLSSADWNTFNSKANSFTNGNLTETGSGILTITGGTGSVIGAGTSIQVKQATIAQSGYLSSADWNTFNNKLSSIDTTNISNFSIKVRSLFSGTAPITYSNGLIGITQATTSTNGYLSNTDWNTFNSKGSGSVTSVSVVTANGVSGSVATATTTPAITLTLGAITPSSVAATGTVTGSNLSGTNTGNVTIGTANGLSLASQALSLGLASTSTTGALSNTDWNTFNNKLSSIDTTNISNFSVKVRSLFSGTSPITYSNGLIGITQATTSTNGYLSSADWNTFNNKQGSGNYLLDPSGNGIVARTALNTTINRTITGTANRITLTNGDGVSGNPTIDISSSYVGQSSITTLGTITTGTWNGSTIGIANGGTGQTTANAALNALLPAQAGNSGEVLSTDGTNTSWNPTENTSLLTSDVTNNNVTANTIADVTGLSFSVTSGNTYKFRFVIAYTSAATTTGSRWSINGPATTFLYYHSSYSLTTTTTTENEGLSGYNVPAASNASSAATGSNIAIIEGIIKPSASGTVIARFASEVSSSAIVAKTGSYVEYKQLN